MSVCHEPGVSTKSLNVDSPQEYARLYVRLSANSYLPHHIGPPEGVPDPNVA